MKIELVINAVQQYGYLALFFLLWLGIVGMPIPDEVIVMTGGFMVALGMLHSLPAFLVTYAGVISGLSIGYVLGKVIGIPSLQYLERKKDMSKYTNQANRLVERFGSYSLVLGYFFPVVRHIVPYIVGMAKMPYSNYALLSYTTGFAWTLFYFSIGRYFGNNIHTVANFLAEYKLALIAFFLLGGVSLVLKELMDNRKDVTFAEKRCEKRL